MQTTGEFNDGIGIALGGVAKHVFHDVATFDPGDDLLNGHPDLSDEPIVRFFRHRQFAAPQFFLRLMNHHAVHRVALEATIAVEVTTDWDPHTVFIADLFVVFLAFVSGTEVFDLTII